MATLTTSDNQLIFSVNRDIGVSMVDKGARVPSFKKFLKLGGKLKTFFVFSKITKK